MFKIEKKYLDSIIAGNKNYEIRKFNESNPKIEKLILDFDRHIKFSNTENELRLKCQYRIKGLFICKFKDVPFNILDNIFTINKVECYGEFYGSDICYDLALVKEGIKPLKESLALKEMQKFYGKSFDEDTEVIIFNLDN